MKKITMIAALVLLTGTVLTMTGCKSMHADDTESSMSEAQHPAGCACDKCAAM
jgi:hypothetical protein